MQKNKVVFKIGYAILALSIVFFLSAAFALAQDNEATEGPQDKNMPMVAGEQPEEVSIILDGKTFEGEVGKEGEQTGNKDELIFKDGKFRSTACDAYGFGDAEYDAMAEGDTTMFEATTMSPTDGTMQWQGTVKGDALEGTAVWTKEGQEPVKQWVKAQISK